MASRCPWKIYWGTTPEQIAACRKEDHVLGLRGYGEDGVTQHVVREPDPEHEGYADDAVTVIHWYARDRREFTGDWPGLCGREGDGPSRCVLPAGHHGRCAK